MLKFVVDATAISPKPSGVGLYVANLVRSLLPLQESESFELGVVYQPGMKKWLMGDLSFPKSLKEYPHVHLLPIPVRISNFLIDSNFQSGLSYFEKHFGDIDLVHGTNYTVYPCRKSLKVMSIYDLTFIKYPDYIDSVVQAYAKRIMRCLEWTDLVLTISESSKKDIVEHLNVAPEKVAVTSLASRYTHSFLNDKPREQLKEKIDYDFSRPYLLFVSTLEPRKNIQAIITAFNYLKTHHKIEHDLVLIGRKGWHYQPILKAIESSFWNKHIYHLDYLSDELVALFYSKADIFVYPSYYEGFGLPVLEAMTLGAPVITSNTSSLPEVVGNAALLVDPNDYMELADAILKLISDSKLKKELVLKGRERAKLYSWEKTARATLKAYKSLF
jgi:glycosyltransferase involved in cell wall biosynthesis